MTNYPTPWVKHNPMVTGVYGEEAKCYEHALFQGALQVGKAVTGHPGYTGRGADPYQKYGLELRVRQKKEYVPRAKRNPEKKEYRSVRIEKYDANGQIEDLTVENRMVYWNSKGPYIKTRSNGNPRITKEMDDGTMVIVYRYRPVKVRLWNREGQRHDVVVRNKQTLIAPGDE
jgi:hypothetical protein